MERDAEWVLPEEFDQRIEAERLDAAHSEWERHDRVRRVILAALDDARTNAIMVAHATFGDESAVRLVGAIEGIREVLSGDWLRSPKGMRAVRAPEERTDAAQD